MYACAFVLGSLLLGLARADNETDSCAKKYTLSNNGDITVNITQDCKEKPCITKCLPDGYIYIEEISENFETITDIEEKYEVKINYSLIKIFNKDIKERDPLITTKQIYNDFVVLNNDFFYSDECATILQPFYKDSEECYLLEDGKLELRALNRPNQWFQSYNIGDFCFELLLKSNNGTLVSKEPETRYYLKKNKQVDEESSTRLKLSAYGLVVSSVFMALVLLVHVLLPELRNLMGLMLMAYLTATIVFFLLRSIHVFANDMQLIDPTACSVLSLLFYYAMLSSFAWINVMSFDIWWTLWRGLPVGVQARPGRKGRRHVPKKFWWYNLHGWGTPLILTVFVIAVDLVDLRHIPSFVKPRFINGNVCFIEEDEYFLYVTIPLMTLVLTSLVLFVMTTVRIWLTRRNVKTIGNTSKKNGLKTYMTLSLVMGITWLFEVLSNVVDQESAVWYIPEVYNIFVGFFLFVAFVCKKKVFLSLCKKFGIDNAFVRKLRVSEPQSSFVTDHRRGTHSTVCASTSVDVNAHPAGGKDLDKKP